MACVPTPTQTLFEVFTTSTPSTSFTEIVSTIPPQVSTFGVPFCASSTVDVAGNTTCIATGTRESITTISDSVITTITSETVIQVPLTESTPTATLFSTCPTNGVTEPPPTPTPTPTPTPPPVSGNTTQIVSELSSTLPNGSVVVSFVTVTSTLLPSEAAPTTTSLQGNEGHHSTPRDDLAPIIGGALGGFLGLILLSVLAWFIWRKRDDLRGFYPKDQALNFEPEVYPNWSPPEKKKTSSSPEPERQPYQYGLVGRQPTPSRESSPSTSPAPTRPQSLAFTHLSPNPYTAGVPLGPPTPNSANGLTPNPSPYSAYFPQQPSTPGPGANMPLSSPPHTPGRAVTPVMPTPPPPVAHAHAHPAPPAPAAAEQIGHPKAGSAVSLGNRMSYPYPAAMFPSSATQPSEDGNENENGSSVVERRPVRLSLTLANWNPATDGELFPRASSDDGRPT